MSNKLNTILDLTEMISETININENLKDVIISGEVNDFSIKNGHVYLKLKDTTASINAVIWKNYADFLNKDLLRNGVKVIVNGDVNMYTKTSSINFNIRRLKIDGEGDIKSIFNQRLKIIQNNDWDSPQYKKPIKKIPENIAIISTESGDGLRDVINTIRRQSKNVNIFVFPSSVQGDKAVPDIIRAITLVNDLSGSKVPNIDTILLVRGGGSSEDLWCFNDLDVAKTIFNSKIPIITGIGHQPDVTIADYVSDKRAITPTDAGIMVIENKDQTIEKINSLTNVSLNTIQNKFNNLKRSLINEKEKIANFKFTIEEKIISIRENIQNIIKNSIWSINSKLSILKNFFDSQKELSKAINPKRPLEKGYSIVKLDNKVIKSIKDIAKNKTYSIEFNDGIVEMVKGESE